MSRPSKRAGAPEITNDMINAGLRELNLLEDAPITQEGVVRRLFQAMWSVRPPSLAEAIFQPEDGDSEAR